MRRQTLIAVVVAGACAVPILASARGSGGAAGSQPLDASKDTTPYRGEATKDPGMASRFSELDKDNDGRISRSEWREGIGSAASGATGSSGTTDAARDTGNRRKR